MLLEMRRCASPVIQANGIKLQASTNLIDWIDIATIENATGTIDHLHPSEPGRTYHFYRALLAPE